MSPSLWIIENTFNLTKRFIPNTELCSCGSKIVLGIVECYKNLIYKFGINPQYMMKIHSTSTINYIFHQLASIASSGLLLWVILRYHELWNQQNIFWKRMTIFMKFGIRVKWRKMSPRKWKQMILISGNGNITLKSSVDRTNERYDIMCLFIETCTLKRYVVSSFSMVSQWKHGHDNALTKIIHFWIW